MGYMPLSPPVPTGRPCLSLKCKTKVFFRFILTGDLELDEFLKTTTYLCRKGFCKIFVFSENEIARVNGEEYIKEVKWKPQI